MNLIIRHYLILNIVCIGLLATPLLAQQVEVCNNTIDDDGDGLADQNDPDCFCPIFKPVSLIPNPSFEDKSCCPANRSQIECADVWIQASATTTDYIHTCRFLGADDLPMPLPVPDGEGAIGFRDGRFDQASETETNSNPNWKEYAGACLTGPLRAGVSYKFQFHIGFTLQPFSPDINVSFFGTTNCDHLPFGNGDNTFGCPTNSPDWINLGSVIASGTFTWLQKEIIVTPSQDIYAIAIGPDCPNRAVSFSPYYFFDNLILAEQSAFEFDIQRSGELCSNNLSLEIADYDTLSYQWYKNGVALLEETNAALLNPPGDGNYHVVFESKEGCVATKTFGYKIPKVTTVMAQTICEGDVYRFGNQQLTQAGMYWDTLKTVNNCDSIIELDLTVDTNKGDSVSIKIFPSESYDIGQVSFSQQGIYRETIMSSIGCDSTVNLTLAYYHVYAPNVFSPNGDGVNDFFSISGGEDLIQIKNLNIFDRWGNQVFTKQELMPHSEEDGWDGRIGTEKAESGVYMYSVNLVMDDGKERSFSGGVTLRR